MRAFRKKGNGYQAKIEAGEAQLVSSLLTQLIELLDVPEDEPAADDDPFAQWAQEMADPQELEPLDDPAMQRLFPDAYPDDPEASADFRRFTEADQRRTKVREARLVLRSILSTDEGHTPLRVESADVQAWLRTLNALRLTLSARLGITDAESAEALHGLPDTDPRAFLLSVYEFLGWMQESLISCL